MNARARRGDSWPGAENCLRHRARPFYGRSCLITGITIVDSCSSTCDCSMYRCHRSTDPPLMRIRLWMLSAPHAAESLLTRSRIDASRLQEGGPLVDINTALEASKD